MPRRSLATLFPPPRPVTLAGRIYLVGEFTVSELAEVEAAREARRPDPLAGVRDLLGADSVPPSERHRFDAAFDLAEADPGDVPATDAGLAEEWAAFLRAALRRHHPDVAGDPESVAAIQESVTRAEWDAVQDVAFPADPMAVLCRALDRFCGTGDDDAGEGADWHELVDRVARSHGITYEAIGRMTLTQFRNALAQGRPTDEREARPGEDAGATYRKWERWLAGKDGQDG